MQFSVRALAAASAYALIEGGKVAGVYDHAGARHLRIAAEARGEHLQGYDGDRDVRFGGTLPELREAGGGAAIHMTIEGREARGYDRSSLGHFVIQIVGQTVQIYDHAEAAWYTFDVQVA